MSIFKTPNTYIKDDALGHPHVYMETYMHHLDYKHCRDINDNFTACLIVLHTEVAALLQSFVIVGKLVEVIISKYMQAI